MAQNNISTLTVRLDNRSYDILIGRGLLHDAARYVAPLLSRPRAMIVTDANVAKHHLKTLQKSLNDSGIETHPIILNPGERSKSFGALKKLLETMLGHKPERGDTIIALGGGVVGDIAGLAASILLRGVRFIQIPTTLLAMVDSSVGGKTGINTKHGKNLIGAFYQPRLVLADVGALVTLPEREMLAGYAEVVKYGLINDAAFFKRLEKEAVKSLHIREEAFLRFIVKHSCAAKAAVVAEDEKEHGRRALLNFGHTFGHALEAETGYGEALLHGEAVATGMALAFRFSQQLGLCKAEDIKRVERHLSAVGLKISLKEIPRRFSAERLLKHMRQDKKAKQGKMVFVLARGIGQAFVAEDVREEDVRQFLKKNV